MSSPDLCRAISSRRKSRSSRCRFSIASSTVNRGRTPRNSATSPRHGFRSRIAVGRLVSRASSTAQFTATVVVPAPPLAPRNTCVTHGCRAPAVAASRRAAVLRTAPWNDSSGAATPPPVRVHGKNSFAPARIAWRIRSGSAAPATAKIATAGCAARSRSIVAIPDEASARMSTMKTSDAAVSPARRSSTMPTGTPHARSRRAISRLHCSSWLRIETASCAMCTYLHQPNCFGEGAVRGRPGRSCRGSPRSG